ncbi:MAG: glycosyltransferase family 2 protein [Desulfobulbaceae bacterium]|nr:MAG: glycosyltransferase family 2 protein [Desulfobulbaceae bacterium]
MTQHIVKNSLSIIIPAYNEESAISSTVNRCLQAAAKLKDTQGLEQIEIIVVNDGSTDRTPDIVAEISGVRLLSFPENFGYGAAIKYGFSQSSGEYLGFLDGDGTCDPEFFKPMLELLLASSADLVTGCRMHNQSKMPIVRRVGNFLYARMISLLTGFKVKDTASGMRVIRRSSLPELYPLPDGLHFTPAMTCRALMKDRMVLKEIDMPYHERQGISKLSVVKDGLRFLLAILDISLTYRPLKVFGRIAMTFLVIALLYGINPLYNKLVYNSLSEGSIYRLLTINTLILAGMTLLSIGIVAERIALSLNGSNRDYSIFERTLLFLFSVRKMMVAGPFLILLGVLLNIGPILDYLTTLQISYHWGYISTGALLVLAGLQLSALGVFERLIETIVQESKNSVQ